MKRLIVFAASLAILLAMCCPAWTDSMSWSSFWSVVNLEGVSLTPPDASSDIKEYTVALEPGATLKFNGVAPSGYNTVDAYGIEWIGGFYLQSASASALTIEATNGDNPGWKWDTDPSTNAHYSGPYSIVGWSARGNANRLVANDSYTFEFADLSNTGTYTDYGFRVGIEGRGGGNGFFVKDPPSPAVPEPISLVLAGLGFAVVGIKRRFAR